MEEGKSYHILVGNLDNYSNRTFKDLLDYDGEGESTVIWHISSENRQRIHKIKEGDICYIYYTNLPDGTNRLLFKGIVLKSDYPEKENEPLMFDNDKGILGAKLKLSSISLYDSEKFNTEKLKNEYDVSNFRSYLKLYETNEKHQNLVRDIESDSTPKSRLKTVHNYFNENYCLCELNKTDNKNHSTFIEENGFYYIERHHLVQRKLLNNKNEKDKNLDELIDRKENLFKLCPNCHMEIHHGKKEERRRKIKILYEKRKEFFDNNFNELKNGEDTLTWLYELYKAI